MGKEKYKKKRHFSSIISAAILGSLILAPPAFADEAWETNRMPSAAQNSGNLTISFASEKGGEKVPIDGAGISIYRVAELHTHGGSADFDTLEDYVKTAGEKIDLKSAGEAEDMAKKLNKEKKEKTASASTGKDGNAFFRQIPTGMYLVVEDGKNGSAEKYEAFSPFLISVPLAENGEWNYNVSSSPKTTTQELQETPAPATPGGSSDGSGSGTAIDHSTTSTTGRTKTGDTNDISSLAATAAAAAFAASLAFSIRKKKGKN